MNLNPFSDPDKPYEDRIVVFLDILGFSAAVKSAKDDIESTKKLVAILEDFVDKNTVNQESDQTGWRQSIGFNRRRYLSVSDSLCISSSAVFQTHEVASQCEFPPGPKLDIIRGILFNRFLLEFLPLASALREAAKIQVQLLSEGFLSRGGLGIGPVRHHAGIIVGPALVQAVTLEKNMGNSPTIKIASVEAGEILGRFRKLMEHREALRRNQPQTLTDSLNQTEDDVLLASNEAQGWFDLVSRPFSALRALSSRVYSLDFIALADRESLWDPETRERARSHAERALKESKRRLWHWRSKRARSIHLKWKWATQRLATTD